MSAVNLPPLALYVHIPWCERKCPYCDFNSHVSEAIPEQAYTEQLCQELAYIADQNPTRPLVSIFFGGGTPSLFSAKAIGKIIDQAATSFGLAAHCEITLEANPGSSERQRFIDYRHAGVNRLSIGIQSFNAEHLQRLGRVHNSRDAHRAIQEAQAAGFERINTDLIYALENQTPAQACADLNTALDYGIEHLSWYQLTIEPNTEYFKYPPTLPNDIITDAIEAEGWAILDTFGLQRYEVSAYAKDAKASQHNLNYWQFGDYIGIGAGAHGKLTDINGSYYRYANTRLPKDYMARGQQKYKAKQYCESTDLVPEFMMNALRLKQGVPIAFLNRANISLDQLQEPAAKLVKMGMMHPLDTGRIQCTETGYQFLNSVMEAFI